MMKSAVLFVDGGSRGNPGPAGSGFRLELDDSRVYEGGWFLGSVTNNVAEYSALLWGLRNARELGVTSLTVKADSELMVKQIQGLYKVKSKDLKPLHTEASSLLSAFEDFSISHVYRDHNKDADRMANAAMDARSAVGSFVCDLDGNAREEAPMLFDDAEERVDSIGKEEDSLFDEKEKHMYSLTVKDHFDAAHALVGYDGPCQFLHGHTWDIEVVLSGSQLDEVGILYDFKDIKRDLHDILDAYDHTYINDVPPFDTINPTAEHLSRVIYHRLASTLPAHIELTEVSVWESPIAKVTYRLDR